MILEEYEKEELRAVLPAQAGMIPHIRRKQARQKSSTRTSGDDPMIIIEDGVLFWFYPHKRG